MLLARLVEYASDAAARRRRGCRRRITSAQKVRWILELNADGSLASRELTAAGQPG